MEIGNGTGFGQAFVKLAEASSKATFNYRFAQIEQTAIKRLNTEVQSVLTDRKGDKARADLVKADGELRALREKTAQYMFNTKGNYDRLIDLQGKVGLANAAFSLGDGDLDAVSDTEAEAFNGKKKDILALLDGLKELDHSRFGDANIVTRLQQVAETLRPLNAEAGVMDDPDAARTNDNRLISDTLDELTSVINSAVDITTGIISYGASMMQDFDSELRDNQIATIELNEAVAVERKEAIDRIKSKYANMLRAMELAFDGQQAVSARLASGLSQQEPAQGSIMNLFV